MHAGIPFTKGAGRAFLCALITATALIAGCDSQKVNPARPAVETNEAKPPGPLCSIERVRCGSVALTANAPTVDYAVFSGSDPAKGLVLVEPGGPGFDLFKRSNLSFVVLPDHLRAYDLLMIREPWAATPPGEACLAGLRSLGASLSRGSVQSPVTGALCHLTNWTSSTYLRAIDAVVAAERRGLTGIVGQSYGALPAATVARHKPDAWLVLNAPISPTSISGESLLNGRGAAFEAGLNASYARRCAMRKVPCSTKGTAVVTAALSRMKDQTLKQRSKPLRAGDLELAVMAAAYDLTANESWLWQTLTALPAISDKDWLLLGRLADQLLQRSGGSGDVSPRLAAFFAGVCQSYEGWPRADRHRSGMNLLLRAISVECAAGRTTPGDWENSPVRQRAEVCLFVNEHDTVASAADAAAWKKVFPGSSVHQYRYNGHLSLDRATRLVRPQPVCKALSAGYSK
jgi:hypothetical protein